MGFFCDFLQVGFVCSFLFLLSFSVFLKSFLGLLCFRVGEMKWNWGQMVYCTSLCFSWGFFVLDLWSLGCHICCFLHFSLRNIHWFFVFWSLYVKFFLFSQQCNCLCLYRVNYSTNTNDKKLCSLLSQKLWRVGG